MPIAAVRVPSIPLLATSLYNMSRSGGGTPYSTGVQVVGSNGTVGLGGACLASPRYEPAHKAGVVAALVELAPAAIGVDPNHCDRVNAAMAEAFDGHAAAKAALGIACRDLAGKALNRSVADLLGGARMERVSSYHVVGIGSADEAAEQARRLHQDRLTRIQVKAGGRAIDEDIASGRAVAAARAPGTDLAADAHRGSTTGQVILDIADAALGDPVTGYRGTP